MTQAGPPTGPPEIGAGESPMAAFDWLLMCTAAGIWGSSFLFMEVALDAEHPGLECVRVPPRGHGCLSP